MRSRSGLLCMVLVSLALTLWLGLGLAASRRSAAAPAPRAPALTAEYALPLQPGWNLVSLPLAPTNKAITQVLSSIAGHYDLVYAYNAADAADPWKKYSVSAPPFPSDLKELDERLGFWIRMHDAVTLTVSGGAALCTDISLVPGWNLVGYPCLVAKPITQARYRCEPV